MILSNFQGKESFNRVRNELSGAENLKGCGKISEKHSASERIRLNPTES